MPLTATVITDLAGLADLQSAWQALTERLDGNVDFFASYGWTHAYLTHYQPPDWFVVALFDKSSRQLRAVFPLQRFGLNHEAQQFNACKALALPYVPYIDFPVDAHDQRELVKVLLNDVLRRYLRIDLIFFFPLHEDSKFYGALAESLAGQPALKVDGYPHNLHHVDGRSQRFEDYAKTRPHHTFKDAAYCQRRLAKKGRVTLETYHHASTSGHPLALGALGSALQQLCDWNQAKFKDQHVYAKFADWPQFFAQLTSQLIPQGRAELSTLRLDGQLMGAALCFLHKKRRYFYLADYDPRFKADSPSKILISHLIERTFREGGVFCMGAGAQAYKRDWVPNVGEVKSAIVFLNPQAQAVLEPRLDKHALNQIIGMGVQGKAAAPQAAPAWGQQDGVCSIQNFGFESGERMADLQIHYSTLGTPQYDAAGKICNAVLLLHSSAGQRQHWLSGPLSQGLFGPGQPLDTSRYFLVIPDLLGHGQSSKPSDGLRTQFPRYRCRDMVTTLHQLVTQGLGIRQLQLVLGTSLGAMLAWLWGQMYPDSSARLVPIGAYPLALGGRNWIIRRMIIEAIRHDPTWQDGNYTQPPTGYLYTAPLLMLLAHGVQQLQDVAPHRAAADRHYEQLLKTVGQHDANDFLYILEATEDFDPSPDLDKTTAKVLAINFAGDEICHPEISEQNPALKRLPHARFVLVPATRQSCGHFTYYQPDTWKAHLAGFLSAHP